MISCCFGQTIAGGGDISQVNNPANGCATGTIGPGTYLFVERYQNNIYSAGNIDSVTGEPDMISSAHIAVFDHPVGYKSMHGAGIFHNFVDANNAVFTSYTMMFPPGSWTANENNVNISSISDEIGPANLCVYELR
jgi:hypothetical protein